MSDFSSYMEFKEARARTISGAFSTFLDQQIGIPAGARSRASTSQNALREFLSGVTHDDDAFPRILSIADRDFLGGSFARHTKVWPLNDIDIYLPIDATGLIYMHGGMRLPYTALSDGVLDENPLMADRDRWWNGPHISSNKLIRELAKVLRGRYPTTTRIRRVGEAVAVTLANGLGFDVVPCFSLKPDFSFEQPFYLIPDGNDRWIHTNPRLDKDLSDRLHRDNDRTLRRSVKLFKWWNGENLGGRVESYYAELAVMRAYEQHNLNSRKVSPLSKATLVAFRAVRDAINAGTQVALLTGAPSVNTGDVTAADMDLLNDAVENCNLACLHEDADQIEEALATWREVFGDKFPTT